MVLSTALLNSRLGKSTDVLSDYPGAIYSDAVGPHTVIMSNLCVNPGAIYSDAVWPLTVIMSYLGDYPGAIYSDAIRLHVVIMFYLDCPRNTHLIDRVLSSDLM